MDKNNYLPNLKGVKLDFCQMVLDPNFQIYVYIY